MLSCVEAESRILAHAPILGSERVELGSALGRILAEEIRCSHALPNAARSAMDGYAVVSSDFPTDPARLFPVVGESRTGHAVAEREPGTVCRIFTGALLPAGFDTVIMQEDAERAGDSVRFRIQPRPYQHVRRMGEDMPSGALALGKGTLLAPQQLALAATLDRTELMVSRRPRVAILCTGDELRPPGVVGEPHSIPDSNSVMLATLAERAGAAISLGARSLDDVSSIAHALSEGAKHCDLVVSVGGASVGEHDLVQEALRAAGGSVDFWKVRIKPGKPLLFGTLGAALVLCLPGNPFSAWLTFARFGLPLLRKMQSASVLVPRRVSRPMACAYGRKPGRAGYVLATISPRGVTPLASQSSGSVVSLAQADTLIELAEDRTDLRVGEPVDTIDIDSV